jgi:hypothetical protein
MARTSLSLRAKLHLTQSRVVASSHALYPYYHSETQPSRAPRNQTTRAQTYSSARACFTSKNQTVPSGRVVVRWMLSLLPAREWRSRIAATPVAPREQAMIENFIPFAQRGYIKRNRSAARRCALKYVVLLVQAADRKGERQLHGGNAKCRLRQLEGYRFIHIGENRSHGYVASIERR